MARAMVIQERQSDGSFRPGSVFQATPRRLEYRALAGDIRRENWCRAVKEQSSPPHMPDGSDGTWEDWIGWAISAFSNGFSTWCNEVEPEVTIEQTFQREVIGVKPKPLTAPDTQPNDVIPESLSGYKKVRPA